MTQVTRPPAYRRLRGYAMDPSLSTVLETAGINEATFTVPWESLKPGPVGEYIEVVDHDPASERLYEPVDLEHPFVLAQDGLDPSESSPQSHQQMVYAVVMTTIKNFEMALGRKALWGQGKEPKQNPAPGENPNRYFDVPRLRVYPHALRGTNAFYSPVQKALLFGYFEANEDDGIHAPRSTVFTCLSHDIVAHETTHALLDGMHRRYIEPVSPDSLAFHEAFADLVALFQHFTFPEVLRSEVAHTRGDLNKPNLLVELAQEFGRAIGNHHSLRSAIGAPVDPAAMANTREPHDRGAILVAAVFEAFITIYRQRSKRHVRMATGGTGVLPDGDLPTLLVDALADEAAKTAQQFLGMCIRALDYCPPAGITFGDYLRALITADRDMVPEDLYGYRIALIDAFRKRGIFAQGVTILSEEELAWPSMQDRAGGLIWLFEMLRDKADWLRYEGVRDRIQQKTKDAQGALHEFIKDAVRDKNITRLDEFSRFCGLYLGPDAQKLGIALDKDGLPVFEVHQVRTAFRSRPDGTLLNHALLTLTQRRTIRTADGSSYQFRGGSTLIVDLDTLTLRYCIRCPITDEERRTATEEYVMNELPVGVRARFFGNDATARNEPFAFLHGDNWNNADHG
ncbi:MAG: hypothetical protein ABI432_12830 [Flavobacteriales bacterium]